MKRCLLALLAGATAAGALAQQVPDRDYLPEIPRPRYAAGQGPVVCVDEAHHNFHTLDGRFFAFGQLLRRDGFQLRAHTDRFDSASLARCRVLVISNAQPSPEEWDSYPHPTPSAFAADEIAAVHGWVKGGGALLLIADHMPLAGAAARLAAAFDVEFHDGFAMREPRTAEPDIFSTAAGTLRPHPITGTGAHAVSRIRTFTGQAFRAARADPVLVFPAGYVQLLPEKAWQFTPATRRVPVEGWLQAAVQTEGRGRAAFFGEAAMFTAQLAGPDKSPMGMNSPGAEQNFQLTLNLLYWLTGTL
jgi:hypothetical protein